LGIYFKDDPKRHEKYKLLSAKNAIKAKNFSSAQETYGTLGEYFKLTDPAKYEKYTLLSVENALHAGDFQEARKTLSKLATYLAASGATLEKVEPLLQQLIKPPLFHSFQYKYIANIYRLLGDLDTALKYAQQGVEKNQGDHSSDYYLGLVHRDRGDYANALAAFEKAVELGGYKDHVHARNETQRILDNIELWKKQSTEDFSKTAATAHKYLQANKGAILVKLAAVADAYRKDSINTLVFRPYRQAVAALRGDTQVDHNTAFSRQGFVAGQVSSPRNILDFYMNYYEGCVAENAFRSNHHGYVIGNSATDLAAVLLAELSPVLLSHDVIQDKEFQQQEILVAERETRKANGVSWDSNPVLHAMATMAEENAALLGWLIQQQGKNAAA
jgi:tetratricopeptide (TPR) repeat protein